MSTMWGPVRIALIAIMVVLSEGFTRAAPAVETLAMPGSKQRQALAPPHAASVIPMQEEVVPSYMFRAPYFQGDLTFHSATSIQPRRPPTVAELMSKLCGKYMSALQEHPLLTKAITAAVVQALGDLFSQSLTSFLSGAARQFDFARTLCFALVGFFFNAPLLDTSYKITARFGQRMQRVHKLTNNQRIASELAWDQTVGVLAFYPAYFYVYEFFSAMVNGRAFQFLPFTFSGLAPVFSAMFASYTVWPLAQYISFRYVPQQLRVLHTNLVAVLWNTYFCARVAG